MENFNLKRFLVENKLTTNSKIMKENVEVDEVELGGVLFTVEDLDPLDDGVILSITKHPKGYFITGEVRDEDGDVEEGYGYGVDFEGNRLENITDPEELN
jgi:hypothetical protein